MRRTVLCVTVRETETRYGASDLPGALVWTRSIGEKLWNVPEMSFQFSKSNNSQRSGVEKWLCSGFSLRWSINQRFSDFHSFSPILRVHTKAPGRSEAPYLVSVSLTVTHKTVLLISDLGWLGDYPCAVKKDHENCSWNPGKPRKSYTDCSRT
jgi:hypothetical protein